MIARRALLLAGLFSPRAAMAQPARPLVAVLTIGAGQAARIVARFPGHLLAAGLRVGHDLDLDIRHGTPEELPALAREIVRRAPRLIITTGSPAAVAVAAATPDIPLLVLGPDPTELGLAESLAQPGGRVTGVIIFAGDLDVKRLELLAEALPQVSRLGVLVLEGAPLRAQHDAALRQAAAVLGRELLIFPTRGRVDPALFDRMAAEGIGGLVVSASPAFFDQIGPLAAMAGARGIPLACQWREMAEAGCLLSYGPDRNLAWRRIAGMAAEILRGTPPHRLPIERPMRFELVLNGGAARRLGLDLPTSLLARAEEVIE
jgi:putative ABC transport system substrate-binding protein